MSDLISVIVPVYNVEKYLGRCIDSLINQTHSNLEIILINDGSTDSSGKICDDFAKIDNRIKVIHQHNKGQGFSRNIGLNIASGDYIGFVDSDDAISIYMYEVLLNSLKGNSGEVATTLDTTKISNLYNNNDLQNFKVLIVENPLSYYLHHDFNSVWRRLYKAEVLKKVRFRNTKQDEDLFFTFDVMSKIRRLVKVFIPLYYYNVEPQSLSRSPLKVVLNPFDEIKVLANNMMANSSEVKQGILLNSLRFEFRQLSRATRFGIEANIQDQYSLLKPIYIKNLRKNFITILKSSIFTFNEKIQVFAIFLNIKLLKLLYRVA